MSKIFVILRHKLRHKLRHNNYIAPALQKCQNKPSALLIACITDGYFWSIFASMIGVVCVNFLFTYPYWALNFTSRTGTASGGSGKRKNARWSSLRHLPRSAHPLTSIIGSGASYLENDHFRPHPGAGKSTRSWLRRRRLYYQAFRFFRTDGPQFRQSDHLWFHYF